MRVIRTTPTRVGFKPSAVVRSMSRGHVHDPQEVVSVEVILEGTRDELLSDDAVRAANAAAMPFIKGCCFRDARLRNRQLRAAGRGLFYATFEVEV